MATTTPQFKRRGIRVLPAIVLAESRCLMVAASLKRGLPIDETVESLVIRHLTEGVDPESTSVDDFRLAAVYASIYGGLILHYRCGPRTPISRLFMPSLLLGIERGGGDHGRRRLDDGEVLRSWALLYKGSREGLERLQGPLAWPRGYSWRLGGDLEVSPIGFTIE